MKALTVAVAGLVLFVGLLATSLGFGVDRDRYTAANEELLDALPMYPGTSRTSTRAFPHYGGDSGWSPVVGYTTLARFRLPAGSDPDEVASFYERELAPEWILDERQSEPLYAAGPILNFRRDEAQLSVNLESWRGGILELAVDAGG